jgi:hypothetical protein
MLTDGGEQSFIASGDGRIVPPREGFPATIDGEPVTIPLAGLAVEKGQRVGWETPGRPRSRCRGTEVSFRAACLIDQRMTVTFWHPSVPVQGKQPGHVYEVSNAQRALELSRDWDKRSSIPMKRRP